MAWDDQYNADYNALAARLAMAQSGGGMGAVNLGNAAAIQQQMQQVVANRDAAAASVAQANEAWHKNYQAQQSSQSNSNALAEQAAREAAAREEARVKNVLAEAKTFFETYGMQALWAGVEKLVRDGYNNADTISGILSRDDNYQTAYFNRFPAVQKIRELNKTRQQQGLPIMAEPNPATYVALEEGYRQALVGLPSGVWGTSDDIADWIIKDVSPTEVAERVTMATNYINYSANSSIKRELRDIYGMTDQEMAAYVLDQERAVGYLEQEYQKRMRLATVGAAASDAGVGLSDPMRDQLSGNDVYATSYGNAISGFQTVAEQQDTYEGLGRMSRVDTSTDELIADQFSLQGGADAATKKRQLASQERARFAGSTGVTRNSLNAQPIGRQ